MNKQEIKEILNKKYNRDDWKFLTKDISRKLLVGLSFFLLKFSVFDIF